MYKVKQVWIWYLSCMYTHVCVYIIINHDFTPYIYVRMYSIHMWHSVCLLMELIQIQKHIQVTHHFTMQAGKGSVKVSYGMTCLFSQ